jgi:predicted pyridoxine 5'-phosphate oxidase superfamily flavin-nucleotide-binding protein
MTAPEAFHEGERALQTRAGVRQHFAAIGPRLMRPFMPEQHRAFFAQLPWLVVGSVDAAGQPSASVLAGPPGFVHSPDERELRADALPEALDPLAAALRPGASIGLLGIEPPTRRRNRMNGVVGEVDARGFSVAVRQSFGNCPKYIQARPAVFVGADGGPAAPAQRSDRLDAAARRLVQQADTFYIATAHPAAVQGDASASHGVDVSHRGGRPGFVRVDGDGLLTVPDFSGNLFFNTLGNIALSPRAGLLFIDFASGDLLHLAVNAEIVWDGPEVAGFEGAQRLLRMQVTAALRRPAALPLRWGEAELSPHLAATGRWV